MVSGLMPQVRNPTSVQAPARRKSQLGQIFPAPYRYKKTLPKKKKADYGPSEGESEAAVLPKDKRPTPPPGNKY